MIWTRKREDSLATECKACGRLLTNPGYNRGSRFCCGKYRRWYDVRKTTVVYDDGRDERGRYHHTPRVLTRETVVVIPGGE